ncbi:MAG: SEL1-like repeat protein [Sulfuritalea sp.]|nr:SEL1-like repeat protein [Sulfuritalea sp.]
MTPEFHITRANLLLSLAAALLIGGCSKDVPSPQQKFEAQLKRAETGDALQQSILALMYARGDGVTKDATKAVEWYQRAAMQGDANAQVNLGRRYAHGDGVAKDAAKAVEWYQKAAAQGEENAQFSLGVRYANGDGVTKDPIKAAEWFQKAAMQGHELAQTNLGSMYGVGNGVPKDAAKAAEWYQKAATQGNAFAQYALGMAYAHGVGVAKDAAKAVEWYQKAAAQGDDEAQFSLGLVYVRDNAVKDVVLGYAWNNVAAANGHRKAGELRGMIERVLSKDELSEAQRISSGWKKGQILVREGKPATTSANARAMPGAISKKGTGTLFVVSKTGHAITNQHVAGGCTEIRIQGRDGVAKLLTEDAVNDLALVQLQHAVTDTAAIVSDPSKLRQGDDIVVFGFPLNSLLSSGGNLTPGVISALTGLGNNTNQVQITAPIQPGSSGSPVISKKGEVVGVVSMKLSDSKMAKATGQIGQNVNFAVSAQTLKTFLDTHKVPYSTGSSNFFSRERSTADLADEARKWTLVAECWR